MGRKSKYCEVPEEFSIDRYNSIPKLSNQQIANLLDWRRQLLWIANNNPDKAEEPLSKLLSFPLAMANPHPLFSFLMNTGDFIDEQLVSEPSAKDILKYADSYQEFKQERAKKRPDLVYSNSDPEGRYFDASIGLHHLESYKSGFHPNEVLVKVNLGSKNKLIIKAFSEFIEKIRPERDHTEPKETKDIDINEFRRKVIGYKVIPFIDLNLWSIFASKKIKPKSIKAALNPPVSDLRALKSAAEKALSQSFIESLKVVQNTQK